MVQFLHSKPDVSFVAAVYSREAKIGRDVGDGRSIGITVHSPHHIGALQRRNYSGSLEGKGKADNEIRQGG
ncbi:hypothetical protein NKL05_30940 [Mesorhizobium sp. C420B]|uniref:hypothetical protein n=1 Tax=Mesorhizobium sp. C420B TaxID=2956835 RepID=UPI0026C746CE